MIVTNRNIEFYLTGKKDVVVIHNLHVITEKAFYDDMLKLNSDVEFVTPVICILNKNYISERFLSYMTKNCIVFNYPKKSQEELESILKEYGKQYGLKTIPNELINETFKNHISNGGMIFFSSHYQPELQNIDTIKLENYANN